MNLFEMNAIQASEDPRVNLCAFLQLENLKRTKPKEFSNSKPYFLLAPNGGSAVREVNKAIKNSLDAMGIGESAGEHLRGLMGDLNRFQIRECSAVESGGFTYDNTKRIVDSLMDEKKEFRNSFIEGLPFTYGVSAANYNIAMPIRPSYSFLSNLDFATPASSTLFSSGEVLNLIEIGGTATDITNGATSMGQVSYGGKQVLAPYKTIGVGLSQLETMVRSTSSGFAGDALIQNIYGYALEIKKQELLAGIMRDVYATLESAIDGAEAVVPTRTLAQVANITGTSLSKLFGSSEGVGAFISKVLPALNAPSNPYLETNQRKLSRIVAHTSFEAGFERIVPTFGFTGNTTGQVPAHASLIEALKGVAVTFGGDIVASNNPAEADLRLLLVADPSEQGYVRPEHGFMRVVIALAPTILASYNGAGFTNQALVARFSKPEVMVKKCAMFLKGN